MQVGGASTTVTVTGDDLVENDTSLHTDIDRNMIEKLPLESSSSSVSSLVTLSTPGVAADSNGLFHGLGDHASNSFSVDGQPISDQQSKVFSNQIPSNSIQSIQVIAGAPPAEYGDKTSLVIQVTTRSGQGLTKPTGSITSSYGAFGSATGGFDIGYGSQTWGNFFELDGLNTGRFLDTPEFLVFHDKGNEQNVFDRVDYQFTPADAVHMNLNYSRSWFQTPNAYDNLNVPDQFGNDVGNTDQKSKIETFDIAPTYTRILGRLRYLTLVRISGKTAISIFPAGIRWRILVPQPAEPNHRSIPDADQCRGPFRSDLQQGEPEHQGWRAVCADLSPGARQPWHCGSNLQLALRGCRAASPVTDLPARRNAPRRDISRTAHSIPVLLPYDLTRAGSNYNYFGHADVKELALYIEDSIKAGNWLFNLGIRGDIYNGLARATQAEPRLGASYNIKRTNTVLRVSYARTLETPFNENLVLSSEGCANEVLSPLLSARPVCRARCSPGFATSSMRACSRLSGKILCSAASTSGSTRIMHSTSAFWAILPLLSRLIGTIRRFPGLRCAPMCLTSITSRRLL